MLLVASLLLGGHPASGVDEEVPGSVGHVVAHSSPWTVVVPEALALPALRGGFNLQPALLFAGQTDSENGPVPERLRAWQPPPGDSRKEYGRESGII